MNGDEIRNKAAAYVGKSVDDATALEIINDALDEISDLGLCYANIDVTAEAGKWYDLPDDATAVVQVTDSEGNFVYNWKQLGQRIMFSIPGSYVISARRQPPHIESLSVEPQIHPLYHQAIATYFKAVQKLRVNDESSDGHRLMEQFRSDVQRAYNILSRSNHPRQWKVIRHA